MIETVMHGYLFVYKVLLLLYSGKILKPCWLNSSQFWFVRFPLISNWHWVSAQNSRLILSNVVSAVNCVELFFSLYFIKLESSRTTIIQTVW